MRVIAGKRRNLYAGALVGSALLIAYFLLPHWSTQYAAWLVIFSIWMVWFVATAVEFIWDEADAGE